MKNKIELKKYTKLTIIITIIFLTLTPIINTYEYKKYNQNFNNKIEEIIYILKKKYPLISENEIITILNQENKKTDTFKKYGVNIDKEAILIENDKTYNKFILTNIAITITFTIIITAIFFIYNRKKEKNIEEIIEYIKQINKKNYELKIDSVSEDELSILKNEIYKTTIMLKETAENSKKDKINLKKSLEDISHQIRTPLTSIIIMLDNISDDQKMDKKTKNNFIREIKRNIININFLVENILKLSKIESNTIEYKKENVNLITIIEDSIKNVSLLCDLKNIKIIVTGEKNIKILCDIKWQIEAITNILKNCIEYSEENQKIYIEYSQNNVYTKVTIKDSGKGIANKDLPNIFKRFYKGKNSSKDSIGIGLALSKAIIEEDNGNINVISSNKGTIFTIKYYK